MPDEYNPDDIRRTLADLPLIRKRPSSHHVIERPDLWERALNADFGVKPGEETVHLVMAEYLRLLREAEVEKRVEKWFRNCGIDRTLLHARGTRRRTRTHMSIN